MTAFRRAPASRAASQPGDGGLGPVVVAVSARPRHWTAVEWAAAEAAAQCRPLRIVHAISAPPPVEAFLPAPAPAAAVEAAGALVLAEAARRAHAVVPDLLVTTDLLVGGAAAGVDLSPGDALLVVARPSGRRQFGRPPAVPAVSRPPIPVAVVNLLADPVPGPSAGRVVVGIGHSRRSTATVDYALRAARQRGVGVTAVHACRARPACPALDEAFPTGGATADVEVERRIIGGDRPRAALIAESVAAALLVVGAPTRRRGRSTGRRSVVRTVVGDVGGTVVVVPPAAGSR
jgi:hypothetical protein